MRLHFLVLAGGVQVVCRSILCNVGMSSKIIDANQGHRNEPNLTRRYVVSLALYWKMRPKWYQLRKSKQRDNVAATKNTQTIGVTIWPTKATTLSLLDTNFHLKLLHSFF